MFDWKMVDFGYACECSPRGDYRLTISEHHLPSLSERDLLPDIVFVVSAEWLIGGSDWISNEYRLDDAKRAAEAWAREYEEQE
jgi:hypothetical protein